MQELLLFEEKQLMQRTGFLSKETADARAFREMADARTSSVPRGCLKKVAGRLDLNFL